MSALAAIVAFPVAALTICALLRTSVGRRFVAQPSGDRWHENATPSFGGIGIYAGLMAGIAACLLAGKVDSTWEVAGIAAGVSLVFVFGVVDDLRSLPPLAKLAIQLGAAGIVIAGGLRVEIVSNGVLATAIGLLWLVGMTNAFNLLDNMDGLAGTLAVIAAAFFAIDAVTIHSDDLLLVVSLSLALAVAGFLPFNFRPRKPAAVFMGDSGSQVIGLTLASLGLLTSWKVAETTIATLILPLLVLAVPILDTALVTAVRLVEGRPVSQGGRDHASHRLVRSGISEKGTVVLLAAIAAGLGATSLAYSGLDNSWVTLVGVLVTFALLVQLAGFLTDIDETGDSTTGRPVLLRRILLSPRRLVELVVDFALITASFTIAYLLFVQGSGTDYEKHIFLVSLPAILFARYLCFIPAGLYSGVWRFAGAHEGLAIVVAVVVSEALAVGIVWFSSGPFGDFPARIYLVDALLAIVLIGASRFGERALFRAHSTFIDRAGRRRTLLVGAGRSGRSLLRELRETPGEHVVGFVDDDGRLKGRRMQGVSVLGGLGDIERVLVLTEPALVLVTIPNAPRERLDGVVRACEVAGVPCRFVRRELDLDPVVALGVTASERPQRSGRALMAAEAAEQVAVAERTWLDRVYAAVPLATVFIWLVALYAWQSWHHTSPWLFTDELELTQLSRSIADTGQAARRGQPHFFETLYTYLTAPAWWLSSTAQAYDVVRYIGVFTMTAVVFPTYFLARTIVRTPAALFAAAAAAAVPAMAYSQMIVEEALAYPYAALTFFLIVKALAERTRWWITGAVVASLVAPLVRGELAVIPVVFGLAAFLFFLTSVGGRRWRSGWGVWDWVGAVVLTTGFLVFFSATAGNFSQSWSIATGHYRERMLHYGVWAAGAFTIGLGVLPVVAALAGLVRPKDEPRTPPLRAFTALLGAAVIGFGLYTAVKASYLSTAYGTVIVERNLIYLVPLVFCGMALWLERPRLLWLPLAVATGAVAYILVASNYALANVPYSDALGLAIAQMANRNLSFTDNDVQWALIVVLAVSVGLLVAPRFLRDRPRVAMGVVVAAGALVLAWTLTGEISAAKYSNDSGKLITRNFPRPLSWLDEVTGGEPALYLGQNIEPGAALGIWLTEFWNRSLKYVWSLDGTAPGPGPVLTPDLVATNGRLTPDPGARYVVVEPGTDLVGKVVAQPPKSGRWTVYELDGPLRLAHAQTGVFTDGWMGAESAYNQYATQTGQGGNVLVSLSRKTWGGPDKPGHVLIRVGPLVRGADKQPHIGRVTASRRWTIHSGERGTFVMPTPRPPFRVEVTIDPTFSPADYPGQSDRRELGAVVGYRFYQRGEAPMR